MTTTFVDEICTLLETYKGRDKVLRTICYTTKLVGGLTKSPILEKRMKDVSSQMSHARLILRLLDDIPQLKYVYEYGLGNAEEDGAMSVLGIITNVIDVVYYPIEKMAWFAENNLISGLVPEKWDTWSSVFWAASIYFTLMKTMRHIAVLEKRKSQKSENIEYLTARQKYEFITCFRLSLDFVHAVNTLPSGFMWSSKLKTWHVGLIASISSFVGLYQVFVKPQL